jgi:hypothetical protein
MISSKARSMAHIEPFRARFGWNASPEWRDGRRTVMRRGKP